MGGGGPGGRNVPQALQRGGGDRPTRGCGAPWAWERRRGECWLPPRVELTQELVGAIGSDGGTGKKFPRGVGGLPVSCSSWIVRGSVCPCPGIVAGGREMVRCCQCFPEPTRDLPRATATLWSFLTEALNPALQAKRVGPGWPQPVARRGASNLRSVPQTLPPCPAQGSPRAAASRPSPRLEVRRPATARRSATGVRTRGRGRPLPRRTLCMGWARRGFRGLSRVPRAQTELCRAAPPSSCPVTSTQWTQCVPAAFLCKNYSCMGRHFILSDLASSPPLFP